MSKLAECETDKRIVELEAHINVLREALGLCNFDASVFDKEVRFEYQEKVRKARKSTPAQSLQAHDDEVIERCAKVAMDWDITGIAIADAIRTLKGNQI